MEEPSGNGFMGYDVGRQLLPPTLFIHKEIADLPRVAIFSTTPISCSTATGSLLATLFHDWPSKSLLQVSVSIPEDEVSTRYPEPLISKSQIKELQSSSFLPFRLASLLGMRLGLGSFLEFHSANLPQIQQAIQIFKPDVIYARVVGHPLYYVRLPRLIAKRLNIPLVCHIMDNYEQLLCPSSSRLKRLIIRHVYSWQLRKLVTSARVNLAISGSMSAAFSLRYKQVFNEIHNGVDPDDWAQGAPLKVSQNYRNRPFRMVLAGSLADAKEAAVVRRLCCALNKLNLSSTDQYELVLNVPEGSLKVARRLMGDYQGVIAQGYLPLEEYRSLLQGADALILARNFDERTRAYTEYSFHNKLPEYMASGTPIICIGPDWCHSVRYLESEGAGVIVKDSSVESLQRAVQRLRQNPGEGARLAEKARHLAFSELNIYCIRAHFRELLQAAVRGERVSHA